jgi:hypothetical protein
MDIGRFLVEKGTDVNTLREGDMAMHGKRLHMTAIWTLFGSWLSGPNSNTQRGKYSNALLAASHEGGLDVVQFLVENGADLKTQGGKAPELAAKRGRLDMVKVLVEHGVDLKTQSF